MHNDITVQIIKAVQVCILAVMPSLVWIHEGITANTRTWTALIIWTVTYVIVHKQKQERILTLHEVCSCACVQDVFSLFVLKFAQQTDLFSSVSTTNLLLHKYASSFGHGVCACNIFTTKLKSVLLLHTLNISLHTYSNISACTAAIMKHYFYF